jgi:hypothetical protein
MAFKDPERAREYYREWQRKNRDKTAAAHKRWYESGGKEVRKKYGQNPEKKDIHKKAHDKWYRESGGKEVRKKYRINNIEKCQKLERDWARERRKDPLFKLISNMRARTRAILKNGNAVKLKSTMELLDVPDAEFLWKHLEKTFKPGMTRYNNGQYNGKNKVWHIDHIIPCSAFDLKCPLQQVLCFHHCNLQALWAEDNISKSDKILSPDAPV